MNKITSFIRGHKVFSICLSVVALLIILGGMFYCLLWVLYCPNSRVAHKLRYPRQKVTVDVCSFFSPAGWSISVNDEFDPAQKHNLVTIQQWLFEKEDKLPLLPYIDFRFGNNMNEKFFLSGGIGKFMVNMNVLPQVYKVDGKELLIWRYEGSKFHFPKDRPDYIAESKEYKSVSIAFCGKDFGFYGSFWGLPEHEHDFWDTLMTIQWK